MGDAYEYPEIRMARFQYAMLWLPKKVRADYGLREQWINNNLNELHFSKGWHESAHAHLAATRFPSGSFFGSHQCTAQRFSMLRGWFVSLRFI
eukprot:scaffold7890_cov112-Isochrysis_galbana.AAC.5